jgi:putative ABC transport system permease protein
MRLALREILRTRGRYASILAATTLIVFLVLILAALGDGLYYGATGALRSSGAELQVFAEDGRESLLRSQLPAETPAAVAEVPGVRAAGATSVLLGAASDGTAERDVALFGFAAGAPGAPTEIAAGRLPTSGDGAAAAADVALRDAGVQLGDRFTFAGTDTPITIVGFVEDTRYQLQDTLWVPVEILQSIREQARPETQGGPATIAAVPVALDDPASADAVAAAIEAAVPGTVVVTTADAIAAIPGVSEQQSTLRTIIVTSFLVAGLVIGLFFALLTLEKTGLLAMLKAVGASSRYLVSGLLLQAVLVAAAALVAGSLLAWLTGQALPRDVPVLFRGETLAVLAPATLLTAAAGAAASFRRVARLDPASSIGGTL